MLQISDARGVVFDVDETLSDTGVGDPKTGIHERARLQATHEAGKHHNLPRLLAVTPQENAAFFFDAPVHSLEGALWHMLYATGIVASEAIDPAHPLLLELATRKNELGMAFLRTDGKPVAGAVAFVEWLAAQGLEHRMAIASTANRAEIDIFLNELTDLHRFFPNKRIFSKDNVTHLKPHPDAFNKGFLSLGLPESARSRVLAFEDNPRGIMSAKAAGLFTCAITTIYSKKQLAELAVAPDLICGSYAEFRKALQHKDR